MVNDRTRHKTCRTSCTTCSSARQSTGSPLKTVSRSMPASWSASDIGPRSQRPRGSPILLSSGSFRSITKTGQAWLPARLQPPAARLLGSQRSTTSHGPTKSSSQKSDSHSVPPVIESGKRKNGSRHTPGAWTWTHSSVSGVGDAAAGRTNRSISEPTCQRDNVVSPTPSAPPSRSHLPFQGNGPGPCL